MAIRFHRNIFYSARLNLTLFYMLILIVFSLTLTLGTRGLALDAYRNSDLAQRGAIHHLFIRAFDFDQDQPPQMPDSGVATIQSQQEAVVRQHLNEDLLIINLIALVVGGVVSWWYAGKTLRPIEESHEAQKRFASDASHELRTPLTNLRVENEVFLRQKNFTHDEARELIVSNLEEVQRLESLAGNLLALAQFDNINLEMSDVPVQNIVESGVNSVSKAAGAKKVTIKQDIEPGSARGQQESLSQLLSIVLDNAVKYGPEKSKIFVEGKLEGSSYILKVKDEGPGIDDADMTHIFERLYRGDKARSSQAGGYGLGLSLAREIANANNATVEANSNAKKGAEFIIRMNKA
jgi:two-component system sensor histidine kinase CiaH